ncbi:MAG: pilus assembly protein [Pirellulaceae bacterium]
MKFKHFRRRERTGAVAVEFALTAGILFLVVITCLEFCRLNMIRHTADNAAYEAARRGICFGASASEVTQAAQNIMSSVSARGTQIEVDPTVIEDDTETVTVTISVPLDQNGIVAPKFLAGKTFTTEVTMNRDVLN